MKANVMLLWRSPDKSVGDAVKVTGEGSTIKDTVEDAVAQLMTALDKAPDKVVFGWYHLDININREPANAHS
jgi:hypothetical protein